MADPILFALSVGPIGPSHLRVMSFRGREAMSALYTFDLVLLSTLSQTLLETAILGHRALFAARVGNRVRTIAGMIRSVEHVGIRNLDGRGLHQAHVRLVPCANLLKRRRTSRIFQQMRFDEVITKVASESHIDIRFALEDKYPKRDYLTQYEETDEAFIRRLAAENGVLSYFEQPAEAGAALIEAAEMAGPIGDALGVGDVTALLAGAAADASGERWVFTDRADYPPLESLAGRAADPSISVRSGGALAEQEELVVDMTMARSQRETTAIFRAFDPDRPATPFEAGRDAEGAMPVVGEGGMVGRPDVSLPKMSPEALEALVEPRDLVFYDHDPRDLFLDWQAAGQEPERMLAQLRRRARLARGKSSVVRFSPGHRFTLEAHELDDLNQKYVVVEVEHRGYAGRGGGNAAEEVVYDNDFACVPATVRYAPKRPKRRCVQAVQTAIVVGPQGEEIHTDDQGRIKVRFHWDRSEEKHETSCFIRCMQPWAGASWGFQFIPRIGMEVVVGFEGGDPDRPIVLGTVYNKILPVPFKLPDKKTLSGIKTRSTPGSQGYNELSFEDAVGKEQIFLRAERDWRSEINRNREALVGNDDKIDVTGSRHIKVQKDLVYEVKAKRDITIEAGDRLEVRGGKSSVVTGDSHEKVVGTKITEVVGDELRSIEGVSTTIGKGDVITDVRGNAALIVGRDDKKRSLSALVEGIVDVTGSGSIHVRSDKEIILHVKDSFIRISESGVEIGGGAVSMRGNDARMSIADGVAKLRTKKAFQVVSDDEIKLKTDGGNIGLTKSEAKLAGTKVKLGAATSATDDETVTPPEPAEIELVDQDGKPVPNQRFVIDLESGEQVTGFVDEQGKAKVFLDTPGDISFPDLLEVDG